jgi:hypothetical protein
MGDREVIGEVVALAIGLAAGWWLRRRSHRRAHEPRAERLLAAPARADYSDLNELFRKIRDVARSQADHLPPPTSIPAPSRRPWSRPIAAPACGRCGQERPHVPGELCNGVVVLPLPGPPELRS